MAIKTFKAGFFVFVLLLVLGIYALHNVGAVKLTFMPHKAGGSAETKTEKKWDFELADGTKWYLDK